MASEFPPQPGGIGNHAYNLAWYLSKENYEVEVITDVRSKDSVEENVFDKTLPFKVIRINRSRIQVFTYFKRLLISFRRLKNANVAIATGKFSLWNVAFCGLFLNFKSLAIVHGTEVNFKSYTLKSSIDKALLRFDNIIAVSKYTKSLINHLHRDIVVIPNAINTDKWKGLKSSLILKGNPVLTTVGRISERKGQLQVIKHLPELIKYYPDIHYHCVGIPSQIKVCSKIAKELGVLSYVTFHGSVDNYTLFSILNQTDIFVMLSKETSSGDVEGFGIAILEANLLGIPAIGSKGCGIEDAINHDESGILINPKDDKALLRAINSILNNNEDYRRNALNWAHQFNWSTIVKSYLYILK